MAPTLSITGLQVTPNDCPLSDPLTLEVSFETDQPVKEAHWEVCCFCLEVQYMVDMTAKRHLLQLGVTEVQDYPAGKSTMHFSASAIDISSLKPSWLNNVGLLLMILIDKAGEHIMQISMVTQVHPTGSDQSCVTRHACRHVKHVLTVHTDRAAG
ncbi:TPA: hypothetical protein ACH3X1_002649 [Trebouxia sp. C0004]